MLSSNKDDLDKSITHFTEVLLLTSQSSHNVVHLLFELAYFLYFRFIRHKQPEDVKSSVEYFRFLRVNFHPLQLEASDIPHSQVTSGLVRAMSEKLMLESWDNAMIQDLEEMATLTHELLSSDISTSDKANPISTFCNAVYDKFTLENAKLPSEQVIQVLRKAETILPYLGLTYTLAHCHAQRFLTAHVINDYEDAIARADKILAAHSPGDGLTPVQIRTTDLIHILMISRSDTYSNPEYLEDAIHRFRTLLSLPSLPDKHRTSLNRTLDIYLKRRFDYFGATGGSRLTTGVHFWWTKQTQRDEIKKADDLGEILTAMENGEIMDVEEAVKRSRTILPLYSGDRLSYLPAITIANIFFSAFQRTKRLDYLNETIIVYRDIRKLSAPKEMLFDAGDWVIQSLLERWRLLHTSHDLEEAMQLFPEVANDTSGEVYRRFTIACLCAGQARKHAHPSISTVYEMAMSLMQESLVFSPTLQIQHFRLAHAHWTEGALSSDYASYQIETRQIEPAIVTLERGRALLWSEMRGLRTSADQLTAADPALAERFADINRRLESVTTSVSQTENEGVGDSRSETMDLVGRLVSMQRKLLEERDTLISEIQSFPGLDGFLKPPPFDVLDSAAAHGPVIIINQSRFRSYIVLLRKDFPPSLIFTPSNFHNRANQLKDELLRVRKEKGLDSKDYDLTLASVLADLYELVGKPVIETLRQLGIPEKSRVWWCPTNAFCSLPLHAMGPIPSDDKDKVYFMDLYIPSYTPTLSALIESRKPGSPLAPKTVVKPSLLLVARPEILPGARGEIDVLGTVGSLVTSLVSEKATPTTVISSLRDHQFVHFVCHGLLETGKPFDASFDLHGGPLTLLEIVRSQLPSAEFAFLSACHTAELTEESVADEGLHLAAAMQFCGFRSVIGTMWAMADTDGADLSKHFYKSIFSDSPSQREVPYHQRSARALQIAVKKLRKKRGITLERWVNLFIMARDWGDVCKSSALG